MSFSTLDLHLTFSKLFCEFCFEFLVTTDSDVTDSFYTVIASLNQKYQ